jgi:hypothetical protein
MTATASHPIPVLPAPTPCPAWCTESAHQDAATPWDYSRTHPDGISEGNRSCARTVGTITGESDSVPRTVTVALERFQYFETSRVEPSVDPAYVIVRGQTDGVELSPAGSQELQSLLNAAAIMLADPGHELQHFGWCLFHDHGPDAEDCGPNRRDCTTSHHRVPLRRTIAGLAGIHDGEAIQAFLHNDPEHGPGISLTDRIGSKDTRFPSWELHPDEAEILGHYLLALAAQARVGGDVR